jgi:branched-chain amino acid transport system ATP-binding protein
MTLLQTQNLSAFYGDFQALFDINVTVEEGETVAIIGANGAGKTTFLRAVAGALDTATKAGRSAIIPRTISFGLG